jgi:hypothetical protein
MDIVEILVGPSGAYGCALLSFLGIVFLVASAARDKFKEILAAFVVCVGGLVLGVRTESHIFGVLSLLGFFAMFAFGIRRLAHTRGRSLFAGVLCAGGAVLLFTVRVIAANLFGVG